MYLLSQDWSSSRCRTRLHEATPDQLKAAYDDICVHFRPVMRRFFTETWQDPGKMFQARVAYTRSVAVSSIVGYILGLGDRHVHNILIDTTTAEVIHIDFGIAFDQGQLLPTPETVPFRLTRDMVDGMGVLGVEGVFRRSAEATLRVMREHVEPLVMLLEVFLFDPLCAWRVDAERANQRQAEDDEIFESVAPRGPVTGVTFMLMIFVYPECNT